MSYGFINPCYKGAEGEKECPKFNECSDRQVIEGAIYAIHLTGAERSHKGGGTIRLECSNKQYYLRQAEEAATEKHD